MLLICAFGKIIRKWRKTFGPYNKPKGENICGQRRIFLTLKILLGGISILCRQLVGMVQYSLWGFSYGWRVTKPASKTVWVLHSCCSSCGHTSEKIFSSPLFPGSSFQLGWRIVWSLFKLAFTSVYIGVEFSLMNKKIVKINVEWLLVIWTMINGRFSEWCMPRAHNCYIYSIAVTVLVLLHLIKCLIPEQMLKFKFLFFS